MTRPLVFLDCETDSLGPGRRAWEIAWVRRDERGETRRQFFVRIDIKYADPRALQVGRYFDRHPSGRKISGKPPVPGDEANVVLSVHDAAKEVMAATFGATIVGAVPSFDTEILDRMLRGEGYLPMWHHRLRCVETLVAGSFGREVGGLAECAQVVGVEPGPAHTALGDATTAMRVWDQVMGVDMQERAS